jgi:hypothetical protein
MDLTDRKTASKCSMVGASPSATGSTGGRARDARAAIDIFSLSIYVVEIMKFGTALRQLSCKA